MDTFTTTGSGAQTSSPVTPVDDSKKPTKAILQNIASSTLQVIEDGHFLLGDAVYELKDTIEYMIQKTRLYAANDSTLIDWTRDNQHEVGVASADVEIQGNAVNATKPHSRVEITVSECSTLMGARGLHDLLPLVSPCSNQDNEIPRIGVLNFASAKNPGGGFSKGAQAQEESIARSSSIHASLVSPASQPFFRLHKKDPKGGYYTHTMLYIPRVLLFRSDSGEWLPPIEVDVVSSAAVNAGVVRRRLRESQENNESDVDETLEAKTEQDINAAMKERMSRVLYVFEQHKVRNLVLGSFGTGVFRNTVDTVARIWKDLLVGDDARFRHSFDRVVFAVLGHTTFQVFLRTFSEGGEEKAGGGE